MTNSFVHIGKSVSVIAGVCALVAGAAYIRAQTPGITFATHGVDLKIDSRAWYNGSVVPGSTWKLKNLVPTADRFFNYRDVKPGDYGRTVISMHIKKTRTWLCLDFDHFRNKDNGVNEPERPVDPNGNKKGELAQNTLVFAWLDDGDGVYERNEKPLFGQNPKPASEVFNNLSYPVADAGIGRACDEGATRYVGIAWCVGAMQVDKTTGALSCDGSSLGNVAQTDSFSVDVSIRAMPSGEHKRFKCSDPDDRDDHHSEHRDKR